MSATLGLYYRTIRHLTLRQIVYQVWNRLRGRPRLRWQETVPPDVPTPTFPLTFTFLNQSVTFEQAIDWNYAALGKLWTYNLNYFEWLTSPPGPLSLKKGEGGALWPCGILPKSLANSDESWSAPPSPFFKERGPGGEVRLGLALIYDFIRQTPTLKDGLEPYPISLRVVNWRRFLRANNLHDPLIERHLYAQTALLRSRLEYHLGANHLLENACALAIMAVHFRHEAWFRKAASLLRAELDEQILRDGGHYERSPVYHQLLTDRLLDVYETLRADPWTPDAALTAFVAEKLGLMLGWLQAVTFRNGDVPLVNDAALGVAPSTAELLAKAGALHLAPTPVRLGESGYRMLTTERLECFIDVGPVGPDHQPGHAHADTFSFILYADQKPTILDVGTSTYQPGPQRTYERSTAAHNTVSVTGQNSSEVWGGFRVGRRAGVTIIHDEATFLSASHNGFLSSLNTYHTRSWHIIDATTIEINDIISKNELTNQYHIFFDSSLYLTSEHSSIFADGLRLTYSSPERTSVSINQQPVAAGFNQVRSAPHLTIRFTNTLTTLLTATP